MLRWLLPVVALLAFLASTVTAFAASGVGGDAAARIPTPASATTMTGAAEHPDDPGADAVPQAVGPCLDPPDGSRAPAGQCAAVRSATTRLHEDPVTRFALALLTLAACGDEGATLPDAALAVPREVIMATKPLRVGELVEGAMTGGSGDTAVITLSAPIADMGWNIHGHANGGTQVIVEEHDKMDVTYTFSPSDRAEWYLLVRNEGQANMEVVVKVELYGTMAWAWL
ncbi:MAG: hypothetical protein H0T42_22715 [Deltaproteobacteria bacterium]|nr:hypothetical protein [Deltaproteobacteria bacterium]